MKQSYRPDKDVRDAVVVWSGTTTSAGDVGGTYLVDSGLTQGNTYWVNMVVLIKSGNSDGQARRISVFAAGTITVDTAFASQIALGTKYDILGQHAVASGGGGDATLTNQLLMLGDIGTASASTLGSLYGILGNPAQSFLTMVGYEGSASLAAKLTAARAGYLDNIPEVKNSIIIKNSTTTTNGNAGGTTLIDTGLTQGNDYWKDMSILILSGNSNGQVRKISTFTNATGIITVDTAFASQIVAGTTYNILSQYSATPSAVTTINFIIDGGGSVIPTGSKGFLVVDFACTIQNNTLLADQSGSIVVDIKKCAYAGFPTTASICAAAKPTLSSAQNSQETTLTGWTTAITTGDILEYNVDSATTVTRVVVGLKVVKN
jgi:hypothetical protein